MGHIELAAPVVAHLVPPRHPLAGWPTCSWAPRPVRELKAKQLEKVIYFAANLVTWVDERASRHADLPDLEAELGRRERGQSSKRARAATSPSASRSSRPRLRALEKGRRQGRRHQARQRVATRSDLAAIRERYEAELDLLQRAYDEFRDLFARKIIEDELHLARAARPLRRLLRGRHGRRRHQGAHRPASTSTSRRRSSSATPSTTAEGQAAVGPAQAEGHQAAQDRLARSTAATSHGRRVERPDGR